MPPVTDQQRIRKGLRFLSRADRAVLRAATPLERLEEMTPPTIAGTLRWFDFTVKGSKFRGMMTQEQNAFLRKHTDTLRHFADAVAKVLLNINDRLLNVLGDLSGALDTPPARRKTFRATGGGIGPPTYGCCTYDDNQQQNNVSQSFCLGGLQGTWVAGPCTGKPPSGAR